MKKFEYKVITIPTSIPIGIKSFEKIADEFETTLNQLGAEGWELVQRMDGYFFFKREIVVEQIQFDKEVFDYEKSILA